MTDRNGKTRTAGAETDARVPPPPAAPAGEPRGIQVLLPEEDLRARVRELAEEIDAAYAGDEPLLLGLLNGSFIFLADLVRAMRRPSRVEFLRVHSYRDATRPGPLQITSESPLPVAGRRVLVVDDILDTGRTLAAVREKLRAEGAAEVRLCVLLRKSRARLEPVEAEYVGFDIPDRFVVGYGLDHAGRYRHLPFLAIPASGADGDA